ncbi:MAG: GspH/FimT family pseudopilin [Burkholderiales bacterium]
MIRAGRRSTGFTLVELLVVFAILALLIAVVPIAFGKLRESAQYRDTVRSMISDMRTARLRAMTYGAPVLFSVDLAQRRYGIEGAPLHALPDALSMRATVANQELSAGQIAAIRFLPSGGATGGSVDVLRPAGSGVRLRVDWLFGRVEQESLSQ